MFGFFQLYMICSKNKLLNALDFVELENYPKMFSAWYISALQNLSQHKNNLWHISWNLLNKRAPFCKPSYFDKSSVQCLNMHIMNFIVQHDFCAVSFSLPFPINFLRVVNWKNNATRKGKVKIRCAESEEILFCDFIFF